MSNVSLIVRVTYEPLGMKSAVFWVILDSRDVLHELFSPSSKEVVIMNKKVWQRNYRFVRNTSLGDLWHRWKIDLP